MTVIFVGLVDECVVLGEEFCGHREFGFAEVAGGGERGVGALGEVELECADGYVGHRLERRTGDPGFADERGAGEVDGDTVALEDDD